MHSSSSAARKPTEEADAEFDMFFSTQARCEGIRRRARRYREQLRRISEIEMTERRSLQAFEEKNSKESREFVEVLQKEYDQVLGDINAFFNQIVDHYTATNPEIDLPTKESQKQARIKRNSKRISQGEGGGQSRHPQETTVREPSRSSVTSHTRDEQRSLSSKVSDGVYQSPAIVRYADAATDSPQHGGETTPQASFGAAGHGLELPSSSQAEHVPVLNQTAPALGLPADADTRTCPPGTTDNEELILEDTEDCRRAKAYIDDYHTRKHDSKAELARRGLLKMALKCKMSITQRIGQVISQRSHICEMAKAVFLVADRARERSDVLFHYCLCVIATQFVRQAESEVSVGLKKSCALAQMVQILVGMFGDPLRRVMLGKLYDQCPHLIPVDMNRREGEDKDRWLRRLRYKRKSDKDEDGNSHERDENDMEYTERMSGIVAFYAALVQTQSFIPGIRNTFGDTWDYLSMQLNTRPSKHAPMLVKTFLEIAGHEFQARYRQQAQKLLALLANDWMDAIEAEGEAVPWKAQLLITLERGGVKPGEPVVALNFKPFPRSAIVNS